MAPARSARILVVDDDLELGQSLKEALVRLSHDVDLFQDPQQALDAFKAAPANWDAAITDLTMPAMTGETLTKALLSARSDLPVILCTGYAQDLTEEQAYKIGVRGFLTKPISLHTLQALLNNLLP
jgi:CheY-like chemotaxis protein